MPPEEEKSNSFNSSPTANTDADNKEKNEKKNWKSIDPNDLSVGARYALCISSVVPRPVAVITSMNGPTLNCAPFSYTSISSHDPPIVTHGICLSSGKKKDTLRNIEVTKEWVFNILSTSYLEQANECSASLPADKSEVEVTGLTTLPSDVVSVPRLAEANVSLECKLFDSKAIYNDNGVHTTTIVMGRVVRFHINELTLKDGRPDDSPVVDLDKLNAVGRAGDVTYWPVGVKSENKLPLPRPK